MTDISFYEIYRVINDLNPNFMKKYLWQNQVLESDQMNHNLKI